MRLPQRDAVFAYRAPPRVAAFRIWVRPSCDLHRRRWQLGARVKARSRRQCSSLHAAGAGHAYWLLCLRASSDEAR